ncbi:MAG: hypothetical protein K6A36_06415 [Paludibacteraceae bacterium]|nr:hypothetical protein [Paludibacteraceae bacterium]
MNRINPTSPYYSNQPSPYVPPMGMPMGPMGPMMPPPRKRTWKDRIMRSFGAGMHTAIEKGERTIPKWLVWRPIIFFFISYFACRIAFGHPMPTEYAIVASISILLFFYGMFEAARTWQKRREDTFLHNIFWTGLIIRLIWVLYLYFFFNPEYYNNTFGDGKDTGWYMDFGHGIADWIRNGMPTSFNQLRLSYASAIDDIGYPIWLAIEYIFTMDIDEVLVPFVTKSIMGAYCAISIYKMSKRHFSEGVARVAAAFVAFNPNMIYWCGTMMKEAEMVFLCCLFLDKTDFTLSTSNKLGFKQLIPGVLIGLFFFSIRTALGLIAFLAIFSHIVFVSQRVMSTGKKVLAGIMVAIALLIGVGDRLQMQAQEMLTEVQSGGQKTNMEWRAIRKGGNSFAKYAGAAVFAPLIFTIPFPTFNMAAEDQVTQMLLCGGSYIRNILSFFVIIVMILLLVSGEWRKHVFILAYTVGYLVILVFSGYAQSGRFHMPIWPMILLFAACGVQIAKGNSTIRRGFNIVLLLEIVISLAWNWFKLAGRGMI